MTLAVYRIGPFKTRIEAEQALAKLAERSEDWKKEEDED
jgi:hypothetical protein